MRQRALDGSSSLRQPDPSLAPSPSLARRSLPTPPPRQSAAPLRSRPAAARPGRLIVKVCLTERERGSDSVSVCVSLLAERRVCLSERDLWCKAPEGPNFFTSFRVFSYVFLALKRRVPRLDLAPTFDPVYLSLTQYQRSLSFSDRVLRER